MIDHNKTKCQLFLSQKSELFKSQLRGSQMNHHPLKRIGLSVDEVPVFWRKAPNSARSIPIPRVYC